MISTRDMSSLERRMAFQHWPLGNIGRHPSPPLAWGFGRGLVASPIKARQPPKPKRTNGDRASGELEGYDGLSASKLHGST